MTTQPKENRAVLFERWPALAEAIFSSELPECGARSGTVDSMAVQGLQLRSAYDPVQEAALQAARAPDAATQVTVFGIGLGDLPRTLLARPALHELTVVVLNTATARAIFEASDQSDWLQDPRVQLQYSSGKRTFSEPFCAVPPCLQLADQANFPLRDAVSAKLQEPFVSSTWNQREQILKDHIKSNHALVAADGDVGQLFGKHKGEAFLVIGPGPTLTDWLSQIRTLQAGAVIVAVSTALQPLVQAGITPDYVVLIDMNSINPLQPDQYDSFADTPLVYVPDVQNATLAAWPGPRLVGYLRRPRHRELAEETPRATLWTEGTVAHTAVDLAVQCGAKTVTLFGLDFGYPGGASHAKGTPDFNTAGGSDLGCTVLDGHGKRITSAPNLISYLRDLENYIRSNPDVQFLRADRRSAVVEGAQWLAS